MPCPKCMSMYDDLKADLYAAYRPELHDVPLYLHFGDRIFGRGLDVGCGVGHSARALLRHCQEVIAVDNSEAMLKKAKPQPRIRFRRLPGQRWPVADGSVDVITFAGSLFYLDGLAVIREIRRVGKPGAEILVYDYRFDHRPFLVALGVGPLPPPADGYQWNCQLPVNDGQDITLVKQLKSEVVLSMKAHQLAYTLLAEDWCRTALSGKFGSRGLANKVIARLEDRCVTWNKILVGFQLSSFRYQRGGTGDSCRS